ncbi:hypothetical protein [Marmoricola sp. RAF53]|uniref:hypothetical protein n=1 Tax=Marmoricola sp. RAF53 TaxID=3233059 RepID=UPI003F9B8975
MTPAPVEKPERHEERIVELRREGYTMALYVAICLLAAGAAAPEDHPPQTLGIIWGVTLGLALAHWFAFRVSTRLVGSGAVDRSDLELGGAQLGGAIAVAVLATIPVLLCPESYEFEAAGLLLALFVGGVAYVAKRSGGSTRGSALFYALVVLAVAVVVVEVKNRLAGH